MSVRRSETFLPHSLARIKAVCLASSTSLGAWSRKYLLPLAVVAVRRSGAIFLRVEISSMGCYITKRLSNVESGGHAASCDICESRHHRDHGVSSPCDSWNTGMRSSSITRLASEGVNVSDVTPRRMYHALAISVEEEYTQDSDLTPFSVNRLISCPDLTPTVQRANAAEFGRASQGSRSPSSDEHFNWAEHSPITPKANLVSYRM